MSWPRRSTIRILRRPLSFDSISKFWPMELNPKAFLFRFMNETNPEPGSSGSPCFDFDWALVALTHYGDPNYKHQASYNQGIPINKIRDRLARLNKDAALGGDSP